MRPKQFQLMSNTIKIKYVKNLKDEENKSLLGRAHLNKNIIEISLNDPAGEPLPDDILLTTLSHELSHFILFLMGQDELNSNEPFVDLMGQLIAQFYTTIK